MIRRRATLGAALLTAMALAPAAASGGQPCHFLSDDAHSAWPAGIVGPTGASLSGNLDVTALDLSSDTKQLTVRVTLRDLGQQDPRTLAGSHYTVWTHVGQKRLHLSARFDPVETLYYAYAEDLDEGTGQPQAINDEGLTAPPTPIHGFVNQRASTITMTAPLEVFRFRVPLQRGRTLTPWTVAAYAQTGRSMNVPGDQTGTRKAYQLGESPCGRLPRAG